jgi:hypothetical protein
MTTAQANGCPRCLAQYAVRPGYYESHCITCGWVAHETAPEASEDRMSGALTGLREPRTGPRSYSVPYMGDAGKLRNVELSVVAHESKVVPLCPYGRPRCGSTMTPTGQSPPEAKWKRSRSWYGCEAFDHRIVLLKDAYGEALGWS